MRPKRPLTRSRSSSTIVEYRFAVRTFSSACDATIWPIGAASGGEPTSVAHAADLVDHLVQPVAGCLRAKLDIERGDEPDRQFVLRGANSDPRRQRRNRLVADVLVDEI